MNYAQYAIDQANRPIENSDRPKYHAQDTTESSEKAGSARRSSPTDLTQPPSGENTESARYATTRTAASSNPTRRPCSNACRTVSEAVFSRT
jgi:hypothetical protein